MGLLYSPTNSLNYIRIQFKKTQDSDVLKTPPPGGSINLHLGRLVGIVVSFDCSKTNLQQLGKSIERLYSDFDFWMMQELCALTARFSMPQFFFSLAWYGVDTIAANLLTFHILFFDHLPTRIISLAVPN